MLDKKVLYLDIKRKMKLKKIMKPNDSFRKILGCKERLKKKKDKQILKEVETEKKQKTKKHCIFFWLCNRRIDNN